VIRFLELLDRVAQQSEDGRLLDEPRLGFNGFVRRGQDFGVLAPEAAAVRAPGEVADHLAQPSREVSYLVGPATEGCDPSLLHQVVSLGRVRHQLLGQAA